MVYGTHDGSCNLSYVDSKSDIKIGDRIITSGVDGIFPKGLSIGRVKRSVSRGKGRFKDVEVEPYVDFSRLENVLVVRGYSKEIQQAGALK